MQYVLLIYQGTTPVPTGPDAWATLSHEEQKATYRDYAALNKTPGVTPGLTLGLPKERFIRAKPQPPALPTAVWINAPTKEVTKVQELPTRGVSSDLVARTLRSRS